MDKPGSDATTQDDASSNVFLTEANIRESNLSRKDLNELEPVVSGVSQVAQSTKLLKKRKELRELEDAFEFMKEAYSQRMEACDSRQKELDRRQQEMKEQVSRFERFIKENDGKRTRAELKAKSEKRITEANDQRRRQLMHQLETDMKERDELEAKRDMLHKYRQYLESTVEASDGEYEEVGDILNRYATLVDTNRDLTQQVRYSELESDQFRQKLRALKIETQNLVLVQNSKIHGLQQQLESLRGEAMKLEVARQRNDRVANDRSRESGQIVLTVSNLYNRCRLSLGGRLPPVKEQDADAVQYVQSLLHIIASRITDLDSMVARYKDPRSSNNNNDGKDRGGKNVKLPLLSNPS